MTTVYDIETEGIEERFPSFFRSKQTPVAWEIHCYNPVNLYFSFYSEDYKDHMVNYEERSGWGECYAVDTYYADGTKERTEIETWD